MPALQTSYNPASTTSNQPFLNITEYKMAKKNITKVKLYEKNEKKRETSANHADKSKLIESLNMTSKTRAKIKTFTSGQERRAPANKLRLKTEPNNPLLTQKIELQAKTEPDESTATKTLETQLTRN